MRWATAALAAMVGLLIRPRPIGALVGLIIAVAIYNSWVVVAIRQADDAGCRRIARLTWVADQFFAFAAVAIFSGWPQGAAPYLFVTLEAVFYEGLVGGVVSAALFAVLETGFQFGRQAISGTPVFWPELITFITVVGLAAAAFIGATNILLTREPAIAEPNGHKPVDGDLAAGVRLTRRELEIIQLMASGYSNAMIASRLHLSESTIKSYVEVLLGRLNVRNRTEAVAAASRLKLL
jgi:DNA-binding CsgD family transcriptional regulator